MHYGWIILPLICAFIGWFPIWIGIRLLFHPVKAWNLLGFRIQGILPAKQKQFAESLGKLAAMELFSFGEIAQKLTDPTNFSRILPMVDEHIDHFLRVKLAEQMPMISMFIGDKTIAELKKVFTAELETLFPVIMKNYIGGLEKELNLEKLISEKIERIPIESIEKLFNMKLFNQLRSLSYLAGCFGFLVGVSLVFFGILG